jgi:uncharacterized membrane protein YedE/YeeE
LHQWSRGLRYRLELRALAYLPETRQIDIRLVGGAALFGIGWGIYGYCPGPAVTALLYGERDTLIFLAAMIVGMALTARLDRPAR